MLSTFPEKSFWIDVKSNEAADGELLADRLSELSAGRTGEILVHGGPRPVSVIRRRLPHVKTVTRPTLKRCLLRYVALGWTGYVPESCRRQVLTVPHNVAPWLWGWPKRLVQRMSAVDTYVVVLGDYGGEGFSTGFDDPERLDELAPGFTGGLWTNRIDLLGPTVRRRAATLKGPAA